jgi:hypothetical protein
MTDLTWLDLSDNTLLIGAVPGAWETMAGNLTSLNVNGTRLCLGVPEALVNVTIQSTDCPSGAAAVEAPNDYNNQSSAALLAIKARSLVSFNTYVQ